MTSREKWNELKRFIISVTLRERQNKEVGEWLYSREILTKVIDLDEIRKENKK
jgi:hypothetical protein